MRRNVFFAWVECEEADRTQNADVKGWERKGWSGVGGGGGGGFTLKRSQNHPVQHPPDNKDDRKRPTRWRHI